MLDNQSLNYKGSQALSKDGESLYDQAKSAKFSNIPKVIGGHSYQKKKTTLNLYRVNDQNSAMIIEQNAEDEDRTPPQRLEVTMDP